jgi:hypothetical protein
MWRLVVLGCCAFLAAGRASDPASQSRPVSAQPDFRGAAWGMTRAQVLATESAQPSEVRESSGELIVRYDSIHMGELPCRAVYIFANDKLVRAKYVFDADHDDPNEFIRDFRMIEPKLKDTYGKPVLERAFWTDDLYQAEPKAYLDQDRASSADILPSDRFVGLSVSLGYLKLYTQWRGDRTRISHGLTGQDHHVTHQIEFQSVELENLESQVRDAPPRN